MSPEPLPDGVYEQLVTVGLAERLSGASRPAEFANVDTADLPHVLTRHVADAIQQVLAATVDPDRRIAIVNGLLQQLAVDGAEVIEPAHQLMRLSVDRGPGVVTYEAVRPSTPLADAALLTNTSDEPSLGAELRAEIDTADEVDLLCAFVKWHGLRVVEPQLRRLTMRQVPLRVITTTYMGATERSALDRLVHDLGAEVRIQYDNARTRLHAKAWMFRRRSDFDTAYVGSSNLSRAALLDGVEWNVRLASVATPALLQKFRGTFNTYWNDESFELYDPELHRDRLDDALAEASGRAQSNRVTISLSGLDVRPFPFQQQMLDALDVERRVHSRHRNLIVAATGTGKTVVAALDYRRLCSADVAERPRLLFVAHRREILHQSVRIYREVLGDPGFGELYVDGSRPERWQHVFASIQSLSSYGVTQIPADAYDVVVVDEFHHGQALTYRRLLERLEPAELLALTATPERADGIDVREFFDGRTAVELRLWDALGADLLCPFHYFAVADGTDLDRIAWRRGRYDEKELSNLYTGNSARARIVLSALREKVIQPGEMRALGFCVSVAHAHFMAESFMAAGIPARAISGATPSAEREQALRDLKDRRVNVLFAVDVFNEGLDIPDVDTVLLLRPTESATIFLQQIGRGLRRTSEKAVLTILDFVGHQHRQFRFDLKFRALTGSTRRGLERAIERGFPFLPAGCQVVLDEQSQGIVLDNVKSQLSTRWKDLIGELRRHPDQDLQGFLRESGAELPDVLRGQRSWTLLRREAGVATPPPGAVEADLLKRVRAFAHVDDPVRVSRYKQLLDASTAEYATLSLFEQRLARMLVDTLWPSGRWPTGQEARSYDDALVSARAELAAFEEIGAVVDIAFDAARHVTVELGGDLSNVPLRVHASYQREEVLAALDYTSLTRRPTSLMQGVAYSRELNVDMLFVTLKKSAADFSPTTMYRDYPISPDLFHWESQSTTTLRSPTGQRYVTGSSTVLLFVRESDENEFGTAPYLFLGPVRYVSHEGERPIGIVWRMEHQMPADFFAAATIAAA